MAFAFVQQTTGSTITGTGSYASTAFSGSAVVGNTIYAIVTSDGNTASQVTGLSDNKGNTYTKDLEVVNAAQSTERYMSIWRAPVTTGGASLAVTVTYNAASSNNSGIVAQEWSNSGGTPTKDQTASNASTTATTAPTTNASGTTTVANELIIAGFVSNSTQASFTAGAGYSNAGSIAVTNANVGMESKTVAATGTQTATATFGTSRAYGAGLVTYFETVPVTAAASYQVTRIPNKRVGPMALRYNFRQPYVPSGQTTVAPNPPTIQYITYRFPFFT